MSLEDGEAWGDAERKEEDRECPRSQVLMWPGEIPLDGLLLLRTLRFVRELGINLFYPPPVSPSAPLGQE